MDRRNMKLYKKFARKVVAFLTAIVVFVLSFNLNELRVKAEADYVIWLRIDGPDVSSISLDNRNVGDSFPGVFLEYSTLTGQSYLATTSDSNITLEHNVSSETYIVSFKSNILAGEYSSVINVSTYDPTRYPEEKTYDVTINYTILKKNPNLSVSLSNYKYLSPGALTVTSDNPAIKIYNLDSEGDHYYDPLYYSSTPNLLALEPGSHTIKFTQDENDTYEEAVETVNFIVSKGDPSVHLSKTKLTPGEKLPISVSVYSLNVAGDGIYTDILEEPSYSLKYRSVTGPVGEYTDTMPTAAGKYEAFVVMGDDYKVYYNNATVEFEIVTQKGKGTVKAEDVNYGEKFKISVETEDYEKDKVVYYYKLQTEDDSKYTKTEPKNPGKYTVKAVFPANTKYEEIEATANFEIKPVEGKVILTIKETTYGEKVTPVIATEDYDVTKAVIRYKVDGAADSTYTATVPTKPGKYVALAYFPANTVFSEHTETCKFTIKKAAGEGKVTAKDQYVGMETSVLPVSTKNGIENAIIEYKVSTAADTTYTTTYPVEEGTYKVRVTFPENEYYLACSAETTFKLTYMPNPGYNLTGTMGLNDYYTSDVVIKAPAGYEISTEFGKGYVDSIQYTANARKKYLYFRDKKTGALSDKVDMPTFKIDQDAPALTEKLEDKSVIYEDTKELTIKDDYLDKVYVNGESVQVTDGKAKITLDSKGGRTEYEIKAVDQAGNEITYTIVVAAEWTESGIIPVGQTVKLETGTAYTLEEGEWKVSGDDTVYNGGMEFYVAEEEQLEFTRN